MAPSYTHARVLKPKHGPTILVRPLRNGDVDTVLAAFTAWANSRAADVSTAPRHA